MPKEVVRSTAFDVEVRWSRDCAVQIASVMKPAETSDEPASLATLLDTWSDETKFTARGLFSTLERHQVNELIRILRRARDQAYGKDE